MDYQLLIDLGIEGTGNYSSNECNFSLFQIGYYSGKQKKLFQAKRSASGMSRASWTTN